VNNDDKADEVDKLPATDKYSIGGAKASKGNDQTDDDSSNEEDWEELAAGGFIEQVGEVKVAQVGLNKHFAVIISSLDPGFFAYLPTLQQQLWKIYLCTAILTHLVQQLAEQEALWDEDTANKVATNAGCIASASSSFSFRLGPCLI
jgi:hypothetical protein